MSDSIIGPNHCHACGGEYGEHDDDCPNAPVCHCGCIIEGQQHLHQAHWHTRNGPLLVPAEITFEI